MSDLKAEIHHNRFPLKLCCRPLWGAYSAPPDPVAKFKGLYTSKGRGEKEGEGPRLALVWAPEWLIRPCSYGRRTARWLFVLIRNSFDFAGGSRR